MIPARRHRRTGSAGISHRVVLLIGRENLPVLASDGVEFPAPHRDSQSPARCRHRAPRLPPIDPGIVAPDSRHRLPGPKVPIPADDIEFAVEGSGGGMMKSFGKGASIAPLASGNRAKTGNEAGSAGSHRQAYCSRIHPSPLRVIDTSDLTLLQSLH